MKIFRYHHLVICRELLEKKATSKRKKKIEKITSGNTYRMYAIRNVQVTKLISFECFQISKLSFFMVLLHNGGS
jgi:hypothetical protein